MVRFEDLTSRHEVVCDLADFVQIPVAEHVRSERVNASEGSFPAWPQWGHCDAQTLARHSGELMEELGYGREAAWLANARLQSAAAV